MVHPSRRGARPVAPTSEATSSVQKIPAQKRSRRRQVQQPGDPQRLVELAVDRAVRPDPGCEHDEIGGGEKIDDGPEDRHPPRGTGLNSQPSSCHAHKASTESFHRPVGRLDLIS
jgi:hypothetical protein